MLEHNLDQVTVVLAEGGDAAADQWVKGLKKVGSTPIEVIVRENAGLSYGSWNAAYDAFADEFDYSIVTEDDYMPALDDFDREMVRFAERDVTYVSALEAGEGLFAGVSNGIIPHEVWKEVHPVPYDDGVPGTKGNRSQTVWSRNFKPAGFPITDWLEEYATPFRRFPRRIVWYGHASRPPLFIPLQAADQTLTIAYQDIALIGNICSRGVVTPASRVHEDTWREMMARPLKPIWKG
jgi:hypothetical protein